MSNPNKPAAGENAPPAAGAGTPPPDDNNNPPPPPPPDDTKKEKLVKARVLHSCHLGECNAVVDVPADEVEALTKGGYIDTNKAAVKAATAAAE